MNLATGTRLGPYELVSPLGAGGMGEVYRARDTRLNRDVAIKVLPATFANDPDRLLRFEQEARATSALNHPNILTVHDFGTHDSSAYIVMELLEGEELRQQLRDGALPTRIAIDYAQQIASGLAAAHSKGITHRDLKPENLFVTTDGRVKILDFGLAKLRPQQSEATGSDVATQKAITDPGIVMGTVGYMSPEQARGERVDARTDIFSLGVVLYEMLGGCAPFTGATASDCLAAILKDEPPALTEKNSKVLPQLERLVRRCLEKKPERRFHSAHDLGYALEALPTSSSARPESQLDAVALPAAQERADKSRVLRRERLAWAVATLFLLVVMGVIWEYLTRQPASEVRVFKTSILPPEKSSFDYITVSPDGRWLAFTAATGGKVQLWVRAFNAAEAKPLAGTEGASHPFWSHDSRFIGFFVPGKLKKIEVSGGLPVPLCEVGVPSGGAWSRDGVILFSALGGTGVSRVSSARGEVTSVIRPDFNRQETDFFAPCFLPDGRHFLYSKTSEHKEVGGIYLASLDGAVNERLLSDTSNAVYAASGSASVSDAGYLLFGREGALMAQPFDAERRHLAGEPFPLAGQVGTVAGGPLAVRHLNFSVSDTGVLVYDPLPDRQRNQLVSVDRGGRKQSSLDGIDKVAMLRLSPDDKRFVVCRFGNNVDLWLSDVTGGNFTRFTFDPANDVYPVWSPDASRIVWASNREGVFHLYERAANGAGQDALLLKSNYFKFPTDWSRDGRFIIYREVNPKTKYDVWVLPVGPQNGDQKPFPFLQTEANEAAAVLSPDGQWLAYDSDESGRFEVYVQSFPGHGGKRQVSTGGGSGPRWRGDGKELFYHAPDGKLMAAPVKGGASFESGVVAPLFEFRAGGNLITPYYDVTKDGQKFLLSTIVDTEAAAPLTVVVNWMAEVKR